MAVGQIGINFTEESAVSIIRVKQVKMGQWGLPKH
jgi:hypothetical protein